MAITLTSFIRALTKEVNRMADLEYSRMSSGSPDSLLKHLTGLSYEDNVADEKTGKALTAAGGFAQALERQDLEGKLTNQGRLLDEKEDDEKEDKKAK